MDHARKLKFSSYVHLPSTCINKMFQYEPQLCFFPYKPSVIDNIYT